MIDFIPPEAEPMVQLLSADRLKIQPTANGLRVYDLNGVRLIPDLKNHCAFSRLASIIDTILQKNNPQTSSRSK